MLKSHVIEVDGVFVGAAVQHSDGYRLVAVAPQLAPLNGVVAPTLQDTRRLAMRVGWVGNTDKREATRSLSRPVISEPMN
jgi:hypothetical protein